MKVSVMVSARHVHLSKEDFEYLFNGSELTKLKDLNQIGQYAANEQVNIISSNGRIDNVRIIGPLRKYTQVEISKTDAYKLKINPPVRKSGDLEASETITIEYNGKQLRKDNCCIIADRHIHVNTNESDKLGLKDGDKVSLKLFGEKGGIINNVNVKVSDDGYFEAHIDVDDANAHLVNSGDYGEIYE